MPYMSSEEGQEDLPSNTDRKEGSIIYKANKSGSSEKCGSLEVWVVAGAGNKGKGGAIKQKSLAGGLWRWLACDTHWPPLMLMR